jgi:hypothetical protein
MKKNLDWRISGRARALGRVVASIGLALGAQAVTAAPSVQQVSGTLDHKSTITITGSGFGSKATAAPLAWDDASTGNLTDKWDGAWPNQLPGGNTAYTNPINGVPPPHGHDSRYIAGAHAGNPLVYNAYAGPDVIFWKNFTPPADPYYFYASWYQRSDSRWKFGQDNNYKVFSFSLCCSPYENPYDWMVTYGVPHPDSNTDSGLQWSIGSNDHTILNPDVNGHNAWWGHAVNPMAGAWIKVEVTAKMTGQTNGWVKVYENGKEVLNYAGSTDNPTWATKNRTIGIGGFARMQSPTNWRYFADAYLDLTLQRVVLANSTTLANATIVENQIPSAWSNGSITATVNLGRFAQGDTAYLFVVDSSGNPSATGVAVKVGGGQVSGSGGTEPQPPTGVSVR